MKKNLSYSLLLLLCIAFLRCADDSQSSKPNVVPITFSIGSPVKDGRTAAGTMPTSLYLSLANDVGTPVLSFKQVKIMSLGDGYVTEPLELAPGYYSITDFALGDDDSNFLYAVPKQGSKLENAVNRPLPYRFLVEKEKSNNVTMQVVDVAHSTPADFGYAAFTVDVVNPLRISVFTNVGDEQRLATATGYVLADGDTVRQFALRATANTIYFVGDPFKTYTLAVAKDGYNPYQLEFTFKELADSIGDVALKVFLTPVTSYNSVGKTAGPTSPSVKKINTLKQPNYRPRELSAVLREDIS